MIEVIPPAGVDSDISRPRPAKRRFHRASGERASPETVERQAEAARLAFTKFDGAEARAFLNTHHVALGGRPIDVAGADAAGLRRVADVLVATAGG
ncbi:Protein of unknown function [Sphingomonas guangdongensis]|uniref:Antitoxin Xre/MbcA/ParS-like toxin-binding domain-containing protein n=1 Tax=Sphingomonas guangdongensis TaxID=1141890 RepID=A0A285QCR2_9SPHN|nr:antitoxin Xre/MbcA/ParS toxin-binding domain-containing protein [Sphingomonas guangdongensis]SOB79730.1 Protein of unknown function [Sphingomonas guangdongensis]